MNRENLAWAAGLFEGEGCFTAWKSYKRKDGKTRIYLRASMSSTDKDVLEKFVATVGIGKVYNHRDGTVMSHPAVKTQKPSWQWSVSGKQAVEVGEMLLPWLGKRRSETYLTISRRNGDLD